MSKTNRNVQPWEVQWTTRHLTLLNLHGAWAIPRAGIIFTKTGEKEITLTSIMPLIAEMVTMELEGGGRMTAEKLKEVQQEEFFNIAARARAGGFTVKSAVEGIREVEE